MTTETPVLPHLIETREVKGIKVIVGVLLAPDHSKYLLELRCERPRTAVISKNAFYTDIECRTFRVTVSNATFSPQEKEDLQRTIVEDAERIVARLKKQGAYNQIVDGVIPEFEKAANESQKTINPSSQ